MTTTQQQYAVVLYFGERKRIVHDGDVDSCAAYIRDKLKAIRAVCATAELLYEAERTALSYKWQGKSAVMVIEPIEPIDKNVKHYRVDRMYDPDDRCRGSGSRRCPRCRVDNHPYRHVCRECGTFLSCR